MVHYLYTSDYLGPAVTCSAPDSASKVSVYTGTDCMLHASMYVLGDRFDIPSLRRHAAPKLQTSLEQWIAPFKHKDFIDIMRFAFDSTPENDKELRPLIISKAIQHLSRLMRNQDCSGSFRKLLTDMPDLAWQLLDRCI